jgi:hypothetical protein
MMEGPSVRTANIPIRRARWIGYAAFAWGTFFALEHLYWFVSGSFVLTSAIQDTRTYAIAAVFSVVLFGLLALFPLTLVWASRSIGRRRLQISLLATSYGAMILLNLSSFVFSWSGPWSRFGYYPLLVCLSGVLVALVRPRHQSVPYWMVLVATWAFGIGMTLYGGAYLYVAFLQPTTEEFLGYFLVGGVNWSVEGVLFVAAVWLASRNHRSAPITGRRAAVDRGPKTAEERS